ncbi:MAG: hypothetical protein NTX59_07250 [Elusimicrobia bacterium]|nr:hypothetical protein [Elusimicrobiota bacterium]
MFPVNLLFYPMTLFALMSIGDYEHPGAAAKILPIYIKVLCVTAPVWVWGLVDSYRCPASSTGDKGR